MTAILMTLFILSIFWRKTPNDRPPGATLSRVSYALFVMFLIYEIWAVIIRYYATNDGDRFCEGLVLLALSLIALGWETQHYLPNAKTKKPQPQQKSACQTP